MRIGVIGTGRMGSKRTENITELPNAELAWIVSRDRDKASPWARETLGDDTTVEVPDDWQAAINSPDADAVVITSPNTLHAEQISAALSAGKHVLVEYPPTSTASEFEDLRSLARAKGVVLHVGLTPGHTAAQKELRRILAGSCELGAPSAYLFVACSGRPISRWYDKDDLSGGIFLASFFHMAYEAMDLLGDAKLLGARYRATRSSDGVIESDCGSLMLRFENGCVGQFLYARGHPEPGLGFKRTIICDKGYLEIMGSKIRKLTPEGEEILTPEGPDSILLDTQDFVSCIEKGESPTCEIALKVLHILNNAASMAAGN